MEIDTSPITIRDTGHMEHVLSGRQVSFFMPSTVIVRDLPVLQGGVWSENLVDVDTGLLTKRADIAAKSPIHPGATLYIRHPYWECVSGSHRGYIWDVSTKVCRSEDGDRLCGFMPYYSDWEHRDASAMPKWAAEVWCDVRNVGVCRLDAVGKGEFSRCGVADMDGFLRLNGLDKYVMLLDIPLAIEIGFALRPIRPCARSVPKKAEVLRFPVSV